MKVFKLRCPYHSASRVIVAESEDSALVLFYESLSNYIVCFDDDIICEEITESCVL